MSDALFLSDQAAFRPGPERMQQKTQGSVMLRLVKFFLTGEYQFA